MKILVLCEDYPDLNGGIAMAYAHTRNLEYVRNGIEINVLNFTTHNDYIIDGIPVLCKLSFKGKTMDQYDVVISHAPNVKHHFFFLIKSIKSIKRLIIFFHGHEVLKINKVYPKSYSFVKENKLRILTQNVYDDFKFFVWRYFIKKFHNKIYFVFVSSWMKSQFLFWVHPKDSWINDRCAITYNSVANDFEVSSFDNTTNKEYDYITIRGYLDGSKYAIDVVNNLAKSNPDSKFLVIGRGDFFNHNIMSDNVTWLDCTMKPSEMIKWMNKSKCALMPTRTDAQGVMMCEMEAFGMPIITSDIPVCHEVFDGFENVAFIDNSNPSINLSAIYNKICNTKGKHDKYYLKNTCAKEISLFNKLIAF